MLTALSSNLILSSFNLKNPISDVFVIKIISVCECVIYLIHLSLIGLVGFEDCKIFMCSDLIDFILFLILSSCNLKNPISDVFVISMIDVINPLIL